MQNPKWPKRTFVYHPSLKELHPLSAEMSQEVFDDCISYKPSADDVFVSTYPKSGTTWLTNALLVMRNNGSPISRDAIVHDVIPHLELRGKAAVEEVTEHPRIIKTHLMFKMVPMCPDAKYIHVARNPKDCVVSYYYHKKGKIASQFADGKFDDFFEMFIAGKGSYGDYFELVGEWFENSKTRPNVLFVLYEDLKKNFENEFIRIAEFLGKDYKENLMRDQGNLLAKIVEHSSFKNMEANAKNYTPQSRTTGFIRKGQVGDWRNHLSELQNRLVDEKLKNAAKKYPGFDQIWNKHGCLQLSDVQ